MLNVNNDQYDDELFDSLIRKNKKVAEKAKKLGIPLKEVRRLLKEAHAERELRGAVAFIKQALRYEHWLGADKTGMLNQAINLISEVLQDDEQLNKVRKDKEIEDWYNKDIEEWEKEQLQQRA